MEVETPAICKSIKKPPTVQKVAAFKSGSIALCLPTKIRLTAHTHCLIKQRLWSLLDRHTWKRKSLSSLPSYSGRYMLFLSTTWAASNWAEHLSQYWFLSCKSLCSCEDSQPTNQIRLNQSKLMTYLWKITQLIKLPVLVYQVLHKGSQKHLYSYVKHLWCDSSFFFFF